MSYLDPSDYDDLQHLIQLFLAAHPQYQPMQATLRAQTDLSDQYFLSEAMGAEMAH